MSAYKYIIGLAVLIAALLTITTVPSANGAVSSYADNNKSHHMFIGYRMPGDRLILRENIIKNSSWMKIQIIEKTFNISRYERITYIEALDQKTNGNGAQCSLLNGGPGHNNATLRWKSLRGHGINFALNIYGRP
ncbi:PREDICTED: probable salivary secreted peptide [Trachymyrmex septentrionalis]|uniref:probable salivary secreted peptide n=1 Tax=Trachymyrmex septentrionalis TaxID=34720 RepID=UPI00084EFC0E|nr:PREDICTED: probable salivary secreted peptide [Trachymyrmex septentrionalis]